MLAPRERLAELVVQPNAAARDRRRHGVLELRQPEQQRVVFFARPSDVQVHVVERVYGADRFARGEARAALHADADEHSGSSYEPAKRAWSSSDAALPPADAQVHVGDRADAQRLAQRPEFRGGQRRRDDAVADREHRRPLVGVNVDAGVKALAALAAARLAERAGDLVRPFHRLDRPQQRPQRRTVSIEARRDARRAGGRHSTCDGARPAASARCPRRHDQPARRGKRQRRRGGGTARRLPAPSAKPGRDPAIVRAVPSVDDLDDAADVIGDIDVAVRRRSAMPTG